MNFRKKIHNLSQIKVGPYIALVPYEYDDDLQDDIRAVFLKRHYRLSSTDYTRKHYVNKFKDSNVPENSIFEYQKLFDQVLDYSHKQISNIYDIFYEIDLKEDLIKLVAIESALIRLSNSYESAFFLIRNQLFFESMAIIRMIFEQLNYCINICDMSNDEFILMSKKKTKISLDSTNINKLKKLVPELKIGTNYSYLSEITHIDLKHVNNFIRLDPDDNSYYLSFKNYKTTFTSALYLLWVIDLHSFVFEYSLRDQIKRGFRYIREINAFYKIRSDREIVKSLFDFSNRFENLDVNTNPPKENKLYPFLVNPYPENNF